MALTCPGETVYGDYRVTCAPAEKIINTPDTFTVCPVGTLTLRPRESGDTIRLSGGTKSLKKLFIDRKIPAAMRERIPVLRDERAFWAYIPLAFTPIAPRGATRRDCPF